MKILLTTWKFFPDVGGSERLAELLAREFARRGHDVRVVTRSKAGRDAEDFPFKVIREPGMAEYRDICRWADINLFVSIHLRWIGHALMARRNVVVQHNYDYTSGLQVGKPLAGRLKYRLARWLPGIAVSTFLKEKTRAADLVPNPYDETVFRNQLAWAERPRDVLFLGRLVEAKGGHVLLDALRQLPKNAPQPTVTIAGDGPARAQMEAQAEACGLAASITFTGMMAPDHVPALMNDHRIVVVPSLVPEGFGLVAVEALASGAAVIASRLGGLPDATGDHGRLVAPGDAGALAGEISAILEDRSTPPPELQGVEDHLRKLHRSAAADHYLEIFSRYVRQRQGRVVSHQ